MKKVLDESDIPTLERFCPWLNISRFFGMQAWLYNLGVYILEKHGGAFRGGYEMQQVPSEFALVLCWLEHLDKRFHTFLEIGAAQGGSSRVFNEFFKFSEHFTMDLDLPLDYKSSLPERARNFEGLGIVEFSGNSHGDDGIAQLAKWNRRFDLIHIDGDHTYAGVWGDFHAVMPYCNGGTRLVFHDSYENQAVQQLMYEVQDGYYPDFVWEFDTHFIQDHGSTVVRRKYV